MPASDYKTLFAFESEMEPAAKTMLAGWLPSGVQILMHEESTAQATPCVLVQYQHQGEGDTAMRVHWSRADGTQVSLPGHYIGEYRFTCKGFRTANPVADLDDIRGGIRGMCASWGGTFNRTASPVLTLYQVHEITEKATSYSVKSENNIDVTELTFEVQITIKPESYPEIPGFTRI